MLQHVGGRSGGVNNTMMIASALNNGVSEEVLFWVALKAGFAFNSATLFLYYRDVLSGAAQLLLSAGGSAAGGDAAAMAAELQEQVTELQRKVTAERNNSSTQPSSVGSTSNINSSLAVEAAAACVSLRADGCASAVLPLGEACWDDVYSVPCDRVRSRADALMAMQRAFANKQPCMTREEAEQAARYPAQLDIPGALKGRALRLAQGLVAELQSREIQMRQQFGFNSFGRGMRHKIGVASATAEDVRIWDMLSAKLQSALEKARTDAFRAVISCAPPQDWVRLEVAADPVAAGVVGAAVARAGVVTAGAAEGGVDGSGEAGGGAAAYVDGRGCGGAASAAVVAGLGRVDGVSGADGTGVALSAEAAVDGGRLVHTVHRHGFTVGNGEAVCTAPSKPLLSPAYVRGAPGEEDALVLNVSCRVHSLLLGKGPLP